MRQAVDQLTPRVGVARACRALGVSRASVYRRRRPPAAPSPARTRPKPPRALSDDQRQEVLNLLHSERFVDQAPHAVYAQLLDEGVYLCSPRTMYRILAEAEEVRERRNQLRHPAYRKPQLLATGPNQVWSWDITKLRSAQKWTHYYLYVILDVYSRYVVGWMLASQESAELAQRLIRETVQKERVDPQRLTLHSDRGAAMQAHSVGQLVATLGVTRSFTRPYTPTDNPFSESQFRTLKYCPDFPERFGSLEDARSFCQSFFHWYNNEHTHSGIAWLTPAMVHHGQGQQVCAHRQQVLDAAYKNHPERFVRKPPTASAPPAAVWINPPLASDDQGGETLHRYTNSEDQVSQNH